MKKNYLKTFIATLLMAVGSVNAQAEETTYDVVKSYDFSTLGNKEAFTSSGSRTVGGTGCDVGTDKFEGLAAQGGQATDKSQGWFGYSKNGMGLYNGNGGGRMFAVLDMKKGYLVKITATTAGSLTLKTTGVAEQTSSEVSATNDAATVYTYTMTADGDLGCTLTRNYNVYAVEVLQEHVDGVCENPEWKITAPDGVKRKFTLSCLTVGATIYYSDQELTAEDEGWTEYKGEVTTEAATIYACAKTADATSEVITFATGAGETIKLNAPTASKTAYADGKYTVSFSADQSNLSVIPAAFSYVYSVDGGAEQTGTSVQVAAGSTVTVCAKAEGYENSDIATAYTAARPENLVEVWSQNYTNLTSADGTGAMQVILNETADFTVGGTDFFNIIGYVATDGNRDITVNPNVGLNTATNFRLRTNGNNSGILKNGTPNGYIGINNLTPGDVIIITTNSNPLEANAGVTLEDGMSVTNEYYFTATDTKASIYFPRGTYNYVKTITVKHQQATVSLPNVYNTYCTPSALDFTGNTDVEAYTAAMNSEGTGVTLTQVYQVPAETGVILKRTGEATTANVNIIASADEPNNNQLKGVTEPMDAAALVAENAYILVNQLFCRVTESSAGTLAAGKAYLAVPAGTTPATLSLDFGNITGAASVEAQAETKAGEIYNIQGMRVKSAAKGIYIMGGKKYCF